MTCEHLFQYDWMTGEPLIEWVFSESPWWLCIECNNPFYSATCCPCDQCNPFSGYCRSCHPLPDSHGN